MRPAAAPRSRPLSDRLPPSPDAPRSLARCAGAITCCFFASLKTLLISTKATCLTPKSTSRASFSLAGFQVTLIGRFWVTPEDKYLFGETSTARQQDASNPPRIFKWCLDRIEDVNGNYITFSYSKDGGQIYLAEIEYAARLNTPPTNSVEFITEKRDDQFDSYSLGFAVRTALRSKSIEVRTNGILVKRYCRRSSNGTETFANRFVQ